jgi:hypothetical protein
MRTFLLGHLDLRIDDRTGPTCSRKRVATFATVQVKARPEARFCILNRTLDGRHFPKSFLSDGKGSLFRRAYVYPLNYPAGTVGTGTYARIVCRKSCDLRVDLF